MKGACIQKIENTNLLPSSMCTLCVGSMTGTGTERNGQKQMNRGNGRGTQGQGQPDRGARAGIGMGTRIGMVIGIGTSLVPRPSAPRPVGKLERENRKEGLVNGHTTKC